MNNGISTAGQSAERLYRELTGAVRTRHGIGDALLEGRPVEVKHVGATTVNQVRAVRFIPIALYHVPRSCWFVIPAPRIVALAARKGRGQHSANPFESMAFNLGEVRTYHVAASGLRQATLDALEAGDRCPTLRQAMEDISLESWMFTARSHRIVRALLDELAAEVQLDIFASHP